uniref:Rho-GAP domain-containing protein n=2 Tax=Ascaris TaxID=6251 RepID=A0A0M3HPT0_ASCLU
MPFRFLQIGAVRYLVQLFRLVCSWKWTNCKMDKMKEGLQRRARRMQENLQQSVGLSERKDELQSVSRLEQRNQKMVCAVKNTRQILQSCIRSGSKDETVDKRKRRLEQFALWQQLQADAKEFENLYPKDDPPLLADVLRMYGKVVGVILEEKVLTDQVIEKNVIDAFGKYIDEEKALSKAKEKLARTALDVEVCRKRLNGNHDESKTQEIQNEYGQLQLKLDNYKDNTYTDIYSLSSKEAEIASVFKDLIDAQVEYHRTALQILENTLPEIDRRIASYPRRPVFGCHLEDHLRYTKRSIAVVLEVCCSALQRYGFNERGLFRVSGNNNRIRRMKAAFDAHQMCGTSNELSEYVNDPHSICSVLKSYLRELPEPLMTHELHSEWVQVARMDPDSRREAIYKLLPQLPEANRLNLAYLIRFLQLMLEYEDQTKMSVGNLSIVFGPNLIDGGMGSESENMLGSKLVETLLLNADYFFPNDVFNFVSPLTESYHQRLIDSTGGFDADRVPPRSTQVHVDNCSISNSHGYSSQPRSTVSPQTLPARSRPKWPAPPPPPSFNPVEEISSSLEKLNSVVSKSPSTASNDSMAEYGYSNAEAGDEFNSSASMTRSLNEQLRPSRPPPPRASAQPPSPEQTPKPTARPISYMNAMNSGQQEPTVVPPPRRNPSVATVRTSVDENNRTFVRLETDTFQNSPSNPNNAAIPKPPVPAKPRSANEVTKL